MKGPVVVALFAVGLGIGGLAQWRRQESLDIPAHLTGHPVIFEPGLLSEELAADLRAQVKEFRSFPTNVRDLNFYTTKHEHIGEAIPAEADGSCDHPFLVPNSNGSLCVIPGRLDIGRHYILTGGVDGLREEYQRLVSRLLSFGVYNFDLSKHQAVRRLFAEPKFQGLAKRICPPTAQFLDPFQFNFIIQIPGQTVAAHLDGIYFHGATRFQFPQWLLAAMKFSGLFEEHFIHQVQVVAYVHEWDASEDRAGEFVFWNSSDNPGGYRLRPLPLAGSAVDGTKTMHAAMYTSLIPHPSFLIPDS